MKMKDLMLKFELFTFFFWKIGGNVEWKINILRIGNRALFSIDYETACATVVNILFIRVEIFDKQKGFKRFIIS